jgi:hypothetical protein
MLSEFLPPLLCRRDAPAARQHTSAYVSIRQHTVAYGSIRQFLPPLLADALHLQLLLRQNLYFCTSKASKLTLFPPRLAE